MKFKDLDVVILKRELTGCPVSLGTVGAVVSVFAVPQEAYEVEFLYPDGSTWAIITVGPDDLEGASAS